MKFFFKGLDSLMSVEIKQLLEQRHNLNLNAREIQLLSMEKIKAIEQQQQTSPQKSMVSREWHVGLPTYLYKFDRTLTELL